MHEQETLLNVFASRAIHLGVTVCFGLEVLRSMSRTSSVESAANEVAPMCFVILSFSPFVVHTHAHGEFNIHSKCHVSNE